MPFGIGGTGTGGGGGKSFSLGPEQNWFEGATVAAARTARDTYQHAAANRGWLERYEANRLLFVVLQPTTGAIVAEVVDSVNRTSASVFGAGSIPARPSSGQPRGRGATHRWSFDIGTLAQANALETAFNGRGSGAEWYLRVNGQGADRRITNVDPSTGGNVRVYYEGSDLTLASTTWDIIQTVTTPTWQAVSGLGVKDTPGPPGPGISIQFSVDGSTNWAATPPAGTKYLRTRIGSGAWTSAIKFVGDDGSGAAGESIQVQYSSDGSSWHATLAADDLYIRTRIGSGGAWSIGIRFVGPAGASAQIQYSADGSNWHATFASGDQYIRFRVGTGAWSAGARFIGSTSDARSVYLQYSADNSNWHDTLVTTDRYIRFRLGTAGAWSIGVRFAGAAGRDAPEVQAQYSTDGNTWSSTYASGNIYIRWSYDGGTTWGAAVRFQGPQGSAGPHGANSRGPLWATSSGFGRQASPPTAGSRVGTWTAASGSPVAPSASNAGFLAIAPDRYADNLMGFWVVAQQGSNEIGETFVPWGKEVREDLSDFGGSLPITSSVKLGIVYQQETTGTLDRLSVIAKSNIPNSPIEYHVRVYAAIAGAGSRGQAAPQVRAQYSDNGTTWASTTTTSTRYIRFSYDGGTTWSGAIDLRGTAPAPQQETIYYGALAGTAITEATIRPLASTLSSESATVSGHDITLGPTSASGQRFVIIVPADHDIATLVNKAISVSALDEFTRIAWAAPLSGVDVVSYHSGALRNGVTIEYTLTLTA